MVLSLLMLAAAAGATPTIEGIFLQYGLIGAVALALGLYSRSSIKAGQDREKRLEEDNRRLYGIMADQFVPALTKSSTALAEATAIMAEIKKRDEINAAVEAARKVRDEG